MRLTAGLTVSATLAVGLFATDRLSAQQCQGFICLEEMIVTASVEGRQRFQASIATSDVLPSQIDLNGSANFAELLRFVPGVRAEASGGEGNANLTLRGLPISAGGARYLQIQENGLPVLQFGDIAFATADQFVRFDEGVERIEVVRGGSAATLASNAPGGVINIIDRIGAGNDGTAGGALKLSQGLGHDHQRLDLNQYSGELLPGLSASLAGFYRRSDGPRAEGDSPAQGGQLRFGVNYFWEQGEAQLYGRYLDDQVPMDMPVPVKVSGGRIETLPGIDPRQANFYSRNWGSDATFDRNNTNRRHEVSDGLTVTSAVLGGSFSVSPTPTLTLRNRSRIADTDGRFIAVFPADNGYDAGPFVEASGPNSGADYAGEVFTATVFNVSIDDVSNRANDLSLEKHWTLGNGDEVSATLGYFYGVQDVALTWQFNQYLLGLVERHAPLIGSHDTSAEVSWLLASGTDVWGGCCNRAFDIRYRTQAPYLALAWSRQDTSVDIGVRRESQEADGFAAMAQAQRYDKNDFERVDYAVDETGLSLGVAHQLTEQLAVYGGLSDAYGFNADRNLFGGFPLDGSGAIPVNRVRQRELGLRWREGPWRGVLTAFGAVTNESNYEATTQRFTQRRYRAEGLELEAGITWGQFDLMLGATYINAEIERAEDPSLEGNRPRRQSRWTYLLQPVYRLPWGEIGLSVLGSSGAWGDDHNAIKLAGYQLASGFAKWQFDDNWSVTLSVNNIGNVLAYTEVEGSGHAARALPGRTAQLSLRYRW
ncbi:TonB-dependent receptor [Spongiibacter taiwanensis]|uniref:TonB-dependent receptor domain-containing protein n=1 Tax=Spongiibacter taiwanensis TaxID=1748242 RepID=UPI002034B019|nr:TonB-dependent receptor [Spongiibacter taiwanensis]USA42877.1 TonB-dependent receptor [Spongiibacter taiwanensis]